MSPKKIAGYVDASSSSQSDTASMTDAQLAELLQNLENLSINDLDAAEIAIKADKEKLEAELKQKSDVLKQVVSKKSDKLKPIRDEERKVRQKERQLKTKEDKKAEREMEMTLTIIDHLTGTTKTLTVPRNITTGMLRLEICRLFGLPKKTKRAMMHNGSNIYVSGSSAAPAYGLKRLHVLGIRDGDTITFGHDTALDVNDDVEEEEPAGDDDDDDTEDEQ